MFDRWYISTGSNIRTPITYQLEATLSNESPYKDSTNLQCEICFLRDSVFAIQCRGGQTPVVVIDEADITTPIKNE